MKTVLCLLGLPLALILSIMKLGPKHEKTEEESLKKAARFCYICGWATLAIAAFGTIGCLTAR